MRVLFSQGIPAPVVFEIFEEVLSLCEKVALNSAIPLEMVKHKTTTSVGNTDERTLPQDGVKIAQKSSLNSVTEGSSAAHFTPSLTPRLGKDEIVQGARLPNRLKVLTYSRHFSAGGWSGPLSLQGNREAEPHRVTEPGCVWTETVGYGKCLF